MSPMMIPREQAARELSVTVEILERYESEGLVRAIRAEGVEGYGPAEIRRLWTIISFQRDLGINLAGVEAILRLRDHMAEVHRRLEILTSELRRSIEDREADPGRSEPDG